ncbi:beta strand repeat-containing protein [Thalassolituus oleivorans]|uniref:beta strand repeat-containing protein n=1 Tax=Thalassolituus oleivorans TaxID=187493 RepID=UPI0023F0057C|nr:hypothetical protein [Thalassolituus oleivorans]
MRITHLPLKVSILATAVALTACGGDSSSGGNKGIGLKNNDLGTSVISATGGDSLHVAGIGGTIAISKSYSEAPLNIAAKGTPDTSYELPTTAVQLGNNPALINADTTVSSNISSDEALAALTEGTLYLYQNRMYSYDGAVTIIDANTGETEPKFAVQSSVVTGLQIAAGVTLSLEFNASSFTLYLFNDVQNDGTIKVIADEADSSTPSLSLTPAAYYGSGTIDLSGQFPGQNGGDLDINANTIQNSGTLTTSGADGDVDTAGGNAGEISLYSDVYTENSGSLLAVGGNNSLGQAGSGESVNVYANRSVYNTGSISANAGSGVNGSTTISAGYNYLYANGELINSGAISALGSGSILNDDSSDGGKGSNGGSISVSLGGDDYSASSNVRTPRIINTGSLTVNGGNSAFDGYTAGNGGNISIGAFDSYDGDISYINPILMAISGNISANGGSTTETTEAGSGYAGNGGNIAIAHLSQITSEQPTQIVGYSSIDVSGGSANVAKRAGSIAITTNSNSGEHYTNIIAPAAPINISTDFYLNAGEVITGGDTTSIPTGANGGNLTIGILTGHQALQENLNIDFDGSVLANASDNSNGPTSNGGYVNIYSVNDINISGDFSLLGGNDNAVPEADEDDGYNDGGQGGNFNLSSINGKANVNANIKVDGGNGLLSGGDGGYINITSAKNASINGALTLTGGDASPTEINGDETFGGLGGGLNIESAEGKSTLKASYEIAGGTGTTSGIDGGVFLEADCLDGICGYKYLPNP